MLAYDDDDGDVYDNGDDEDEDNDDVYDNGDDEDEDNDDDDHDDEDEDKDEMLRTMTMTTIIMMMTMTKFMTMFIDEDEDIMASHIFSSIMRSINPHDMSNLMSYFASHINIIAFFHTLRGCSTMSARQ